MKAVKNNRVYTITGQQRKSYAAQGFDIIGDDGNVIEHAVGKTVPYAEHAALLDENEQLKAENERLKAETAASEKPPKQAKKE